MELYLQLGARMQDHSRALIKQWGGGTVILSPRDLPPEKMTIFSKEICKLGGRLLLDPQIYLPYEDHEKLLEHDWWPRGYESSQFWSNEDVSRLIKNLILRNRELSCSELILPSFYAPVVDDEWLQRQRIFIEEGDRHKATGERLLATVALSEEATRNEEQIHSILDAANEWNVSGVYLVCEHPKGAYLVDDISWVVNVLDLTAGLRLKGKRVIIGYSNPQMLIAACASATAIASGNWMNVRAFPPSKFRAAFETEPKRHKTWYYCPQALSEYKITFLDSAQNQGLLETMAPAPSLGSTYANVLFQGHKPTAVPFSERDSFRHYLHCLHGQVAAARKGTFTETVNAYESLLDEAERTLEQLSEGKIKGQHREFTEIIDINRSALQSFVISRGPALRRYWNNL